MRFIFNFFILFSASYLFSVSHLYAVNYYFSSKGNNANNGTVTSPWLNFDNLRGINLNPGDSILLRKGEIFIGEIIIKNSGTKDKPIVISTYDWSSSEFTVVTGATSVNKWQSLSENQDIFFTTIYKPVKQLYVDGKLMTLARFPNGTNLLKTADELPKGQINSTSLNQVDGYWNGANLRVHSIGWAWEVVTVKNFSNKTLYYTDSVRYQPEPGSQFYLENKSDLLDYPGEWFYDNQKQRILFYPDNKELLEKANVKAVIYSCGVKLETGVENIKIENVQFDKFAEFGIHATGSNAGITIQNCSFENIGWMGVKIGRKSYDILISENYFRNILGRGISLTECWNATISGNVIKKTGLVPGQGASGTNSYIGIVAELRDESYDKKYDHFDSIANHITIRQNFIDSSGYIGLRMDGKFNRAEKNIIDHSMLQLDDGAGLYCFNEFTRSSVIRNNFVYRSYGKGSISNGIYLDNFVYSMELCENTVVSNAGSGILINAAARDNIVSNNILYGNGNGLCFSDWKDNPVNGNKVNKNVIVSLKTTDPAVLLLSNYKRYNMAVYDSNYYVNPFSAKLFKFDWSVKKTIGFEQWKSEFKSNDKNSKALVNFSYGTQNKTVLFTNKTDSVREVNLKNYTFYDLDLNPVNQLVLRPFCSVVLISPDFVDGVTVEADPPIVFSAWKFLPVNYDRNCFAGRNVFSEQVETTQLGEMKNFDSSFNDYPNPLLAGHILNIINIGFSNRYELYGLDDKKIGTSINLLSDRISMHNPQILAGTCFGNNEKPEMQVQFWFR